MLLFIGICFGILIIIGTPIGFALGIAGLFAILKLDEPQMLLLVARRIFSGLNFFPLLAIPFFIAAGEIMTKAGITGRLLSLSNCLIGNIRGGLAHVNILTSIVFGGISGSADADAAGLGSIEIPLMVEDGYPKAFSAAITAASSIVSPIIPPSIIAVIYSYTMHVSTAGIFAAGIIPGFVIGLALMIICYIISAKNNYGPPKRRVTFAIFINAAKEGIPAMLMPIIILWGILGGLCTPTEAAAIAVAYALLLDFFLYKKLKLKDIPEIILKVVSISSMVFLIIGCASIFSWIIASERIGQLTANFILYISR